jgi:hypothetical protein
MRWFACKMEWGEQAVEGVDKEHAVAIALMAFGDAAFVVEACDDLSQNRVVFDMSWPGDGYGFRELRRSDLSFKAYLERAHALVPG